MVESSYYLIFKIFTNIQILIPIIVDSVLILETVVVGSVPIRGSEFSRFSKMWHICATQQAMTRTRTECLDT